jgi:glucose/arabinose dehydrogenase
MARPAGAQAPAAVFARVPQAREMAVCGSTIFVGTKGRAVYAVSPSGGAARVAASGFDAPNGVACAEGRLFVASRDRVSSFAIGQGGALGDRRDIWRGLPDSGVHSLRYAAVGPDGRQPKGLQGTIVSMNRDGSDLQRVAWGVRNSVGFDWRGGTLFFTDNGADDMGDNIPPDELNEVTASGGFYGFPEFGGTIRLKGFQNVRPPAQPIPPVFDFQAHVASLGIHFFRSLGGDALVAEHGSWNRTVPVGREVVRVRISGGRPVGAQPYARGLGRPVDVKEESDGSVLVSSDATGTIYRLR